MSCWGVNLLIYLHSLFYVLIPASIHSCDQCFWHNDGDSWYLLFNPRRQALSSHSFPTAEQRLRELSRFQCSLYSWVRGKTTTSAEISHWHLLYTFHTLHSPSWVLTTTLRVRYQFISILLVSKLRQKKSFLPDSRNHQRFLRWGGLWLRNLRC